MNNFTKRFFLLGFFSLFTFSLTLAQWVQTTGVIGGKVNALLSRSNKLFAGTDTGGVFISSDNGLNWSTANIGLDNHNITALTAKSNLLVAGIGNGFSSGTFYFSTDNGLTWAASPKKYSGFLFCLATYNDDIYAGTWYGVVRSTDNGNNWTTLATGLPSNASVSAMILNSSIFYAGVTSSSTGGTGVFSSINSGTNWSAKNTGLTNTVILSLASNATKLFAGTSGGGVFVSTDAGANWTVANTGLTNLKINTLVVRGTKIFAGTDDGIFMSADNGANWTSISTGLTASTKVVSILFNDPFMLIGTTDKVWRRSIGEVSGIESNYTQNEFLKISPNPAKAKIEIQSNYSGRYKIVNELGQTVQIFELNETNIASVSIQNLEKGMYFIISENNKESIRQKLIVLD